LYDVGDEMVTEIFASWPGADVEALSGLLERFASDSQQYARRLRRTRGE
jgi:ribosomal 50S subunit-associated protein YjgA (DUF615 family)